MCDEDRKPRDDNQILLITAAAGLAAILASADSLDFWEDVQAAGHETATFPTSNSLQAAYIVFNASSAGGRGICWSICPSRPAGPRSSLARTLLFGPRYHVHRAR